MQNFMYNTPTQVFFGRGVEKEIGPQLKARGYKKIMLHYGGGSIKRTGLYDKVTASLQDAGIDWIELGGVEPNPKISFVRECLDICRKEQIDFILAVGGGSVIDSAKAIAMGLANEKDPWEIITGGKMPEKTFPVGAVLTISAAGSEMSNSHVITNEEFHMKRGLNTEMVRPVIAFMNPENTFTVSPFQTGCGIVDIMMHTLERYLTLDEDAILTDRIAEALLVSVKEAGPAALKNPEDYDARSTLMWASSLSHNGLTGCGKNSGFTVHKLEHDFSGLFDHIAHGAGLSVLFPAWAAYVYKDNVKKFARLAEKVMDIPASEDKEAMALAGIQAFKAYFHSLGMPVTMAELGVPADAYEQIANLTTANDTKKVPGFRELTKADLLAIYKLAE